MSRITPLPLHLLPESLAVILQGGLDSGMLSTSTPVQVWAHRPAMAEAWLELLELFHSQSLLTDRLRELMRLKIASITSCTVCQTARKTDDVTEEDITCLGSHSDHFAPREQAALQFAELFASDYMSVGEVHFNALGKFFSVAQIVEINMFCALMLAGGRMTYVQQAYEK